MNTHPSITCPVCTRTSYNPNDVAEGFCGFCHAWTSRPDLADPTTGAPMSEPHPARPGSETTGELLSAYLDSVDAYVDATTSPGGVDDRLRALLDAPPATTLQAQGDVMVLPWPASSAPSYRATEIDAASLVPLGGIPVTADGSHVLIPAEPSAMAPWPRYHPNAKGYTLGTLLVPDGGAARLSHAEHADLLIGPGVYVVRQQRRWESTHAAPAPAGD